MTEALRRSARIRVVLPDPEDEQTVLELAHRFNYESEDLVRYIREAVAFFDELRALSSDTDVQVWFLPAAHQFSFYIFGPTAVVALYSHRRQRVPVPTLVCEEGGWLYDYVAKEFDAMIGADGLARPGGKEEPQSDGVGSIEQHEEGEEEPQTDGAGSLERHHDST